jgi:hypothetical protein
MSDEFPLGACAVVILSHGGAAEVVCRFQASPLVSDRDHTMCGFRNRSSRVLKVLLIVMRAKQSMVVLGSVGERSGRLRQRGESRARFDHAA